MNDFYRKPRRSLLSRYFAFLERRSFGDRIIFHLILIIFFGSLLYVGSAISNQFLSDSPATGGTLREGVIGTPRFVNPVLAITRTDQDVTALVYSGLLKLSPEGTLVPDLAESVTVSADGFSYSITLKEGVTFHDGTPITASDVAYTISLIQNPELKSPLRGNWEGVRFTEGNERTFTLELPEAYTPFSENLTVGILPRHLWSDVTVEQFPFSQLNTEPVGSGPFLIDTVNRDDSGLIESYELAAFAGAETTPNIDTVELHFYSNEELLKNAITERDIVSTAQLSAEHIAELDDETYTKQELPLPRVFGVFFNQNRSSALRDNAVREALTLLVDRDQIIERALAGQGIPTASAIPAGFSELESTTNASSSSTEEAITAATAILEAADWTRDDAGSWTKEIDGETVTLAVAISTGNTPVFEQTAAVLKEAWEAIGISVTLRQYEQSDLVQTVIRPRSFETLLFGTDLNRSLDLYPFWHSSQRDDPGLNITQYTNIDTDVLLERARTATSTEARNVSLEAFSDIIAEEQPAVFLYTPTFTYVVHNSVTPTAIEKVTNPSERFANISDWYMNKDRLWPFFQ